MDIKRPSVNIASPTKRLLTRQLTQTNFREKPVKNIVTPTKEPKRLPRSNSGVNLSKLQQIENFMPRHLLQKNLDAFKVSNTPLAQNADYKLDGISPLNARKRESEPLNPNALFRNRILKPRIPKRKENDTPPFIVGSFSRNQQRESPQLSPANVQINNFQKEGFETLLSFFHRSSTKSPAKIFPELKRIDTADIPKTPQANNSTPTNGFTRERPESIAQRVRTGDSDGGDQRKWGYVEQIIAHLSVATGTVSTWKEMDNELEKIMNKKKVEYWNEVIAEHEPQNVEILVVDMVELMVKWHTEMEVINGESITEKIDEYVKEESPYKNEALHLLVYFHKKDTATKTLVLSKYCFYFAKNAQFSEDLKSEKDVIIYYFLILGLCNFKITLEHEPIRKIKIRKIKERAINTLKGEETPLKPILEWVTRRFNNHVIVEKTIFNFNNISTASSTYLFNIRSYIKSMYSKLSLLNNEEAKPKNDFIFIKKANITQRGVVPYIQQLALPKANLSLKRSLTLTLATTNTGESAGEVNPGRKTPVLKKRTKIVTNIRDKMNIKLDDANYRGDLKTTKAVTNLTFFDTTSPKAINKTATNFYKTESRFETMPEHSEEPIIRPEILTVKLDKNPKRNSSATPTLRRPKPPVETRTPKGQGNLALSPWLESTDLPVFEQSPLLPKAANLVLKSLAEELIDEGDEHPSTLRLYLEEKGNKKSKV